MNRQMNWRTDSDYAFCDQLDLSGWAWQFLRREPAYRADYIHFISLWQQLEAAYGAPPKRDFFKWKQDPRAWRSEAEISGCSGDVCPGENDQVLIECWMGAKWGFRKFPIAPDIERPDELAWRELPIEVEVIDVETLLTHPLSIEQLALKFDLSLPLPAQLEAAKHQLICARQARLQTRTLPPRTLREGAPIWQRWLRLLDALQTSATLAEIASVLGLAKPESEVAAAIAMRAGGYRRLLRLEQ
jgi:hypothetical protein